MAIKSKMSGMLVVMVAIMSVINPVSAGRDYCLPGSTAICMKFGDFCCAKITATKDGYTDTYHSCSSRKGISESGGTFNDGGFSGTWVCTFATKLKVYSSLIMTSFALLSIS